MTYLSSVATTSRIVKLIMFNLLGCLFLWWLIIDDPRRKPVLVVLIPVMLLIDVVFIRRMFGKWNAASISLPIIYFLRTCVWGMVGDSQLCVVENAVVDCSPSTFSQQRPETS